MPTIPDAAVSAWRRRLRAFSAAGGTLEVAIHRDDGPRRARVAQATAVWASCLGRGLTPGPRRVASGGGTALDGTLVMRAAIFDVEQEDARRGTLVLARAPGGAIVGALYAVDGPGGTSVEDVGTTGRLYGAGTALLGFAAGGAGMLTLSAEPAAVPFYAHLGFRAAGAATPQLPMVLAASALRAAREAVAEAGPPVLRAPLSSTARLLLAAGAEMGGEEDGPLSALGAS